MLVRDGLQGQLRVAQAVDAGRVRPRADDDEVVVHQRIPFDAETDGDECLLGGPMMDQQYVRVSRAGQADGRAGADGDHANLNAGLFRERRQDMVEQAGILG